MTARPRPLATSLALAVALLLLPARAAAQEDGFRFGVSIGGTSLIGVVAEKLDGRRGIEVTVGTWSFRDVTVSLAGKAYLGPSAFRPVLGAGVWTSVGLRPAPGERGGVAVIARLPIGFDWRLASGNYLALELGVNRAVWMRRADSSDNPPSSRLIPIPSLSYRLMP